MIVSNRLMSAAFHALACHLTDDADFAAKSGMDAAAYTQYVHEIQNIRAKLSCYGQDLTVTTAEVLLPGES